MKMRSFERNFRFFCCVALVGAGLAFAALSAYAAENQPPLNQYGVRSWSPYVAKQVWQDGRLLEMDVVPPCPPPKDFRGEAVTLPAPDIARGVNIISEMPAFNWCYGCSATSAGMAMGHYDRTGYPNMYTGPTNGGVCPLNNETYWPNNSYPSGTVCGNCPLVVTHNGIDGRTIRGSVDDYWIDYDMTGPDPYVTGGWGEHTWGECTGDYMGTSQWKYNIKDGATQFWYYNDGSPLEDYTGYPAGSYDGCHGMRLFVESRGYSVTTNYSQRRQGWTGTDPTKGFTYANFQSEIDAGYPVLIQLEGHTMLGYGYDTSGSIIYIHDTWDHVDHQMTWGGSYGSPPMAHSGVTVIHISGGGPVPTPIPTATPQPPPPPAPIRVNPDRASFSAASDQMSLYASLEYITTWCYPFVRIVTPYYGTYYLTSWYVMYPYPMPYTLFSITTTGPISSMYLCGIWWRNLEPGTYYIESGGVDAAQPVLPSGAFNYLGSVHQVPFYLN